MKHNRHFGLRSAAIVQFSCLVFALISLTSCDDLANFWHKDDPYWNPPPAPGSPLRNRTFTVAAASPPAAADEIFWNTTTNMVEIGNSSGGTDTFDPDVKTDYAVLRDFLLLTGVEDTDTITFDNSAQILMLNKGSTAAATMIITIGTSGTAGEIDAAAFASAVTLTGNTTNGIDVTGADLVTGTVLTLDATNPVTYSIYGVSTTVAAGHNATAAQSAANELTLDAGDAAAAVAIAVGTTLIRLIVDTTATTIANASAITIAPGISGVKINALAATAVDVAGLTAGTDTVVVDLASTAAVTIDGVSLTPDISATSDMTVTYTSATALDLTSGNANDTVSIASTTSNVTISYNLAAITTDGSGSIIVPTAASGVAITATGAVTVDITGLATPSDTVNLKGAVAFTLIVTSDGNYTDDNSTSDGSLGNPTTFTGTTAPHTYTAESDDTNGITPGVYTTTIIFTPNDADSTITVTAAS